MESNIEKNITILSNFLTEKFQSGIPFDEDLMKKYLLLITLKKQSEAQKNYNIK